MPQGSRDSKEKKMSNLIVKITIDEGKTSAITADGLRCGIVGKEQELLNGDVWTARAVQGRVKGEKGASKVELVKRVRQGFITSLKDHWMGKRNLMKLQAYLGGSIHVLLIGPPATGKTVFGARLAAEKGWEFFMVECANILTPKDLYGADGAVNGSTRFIQSAMAKWLEEVASDSEYVTHLLLLDEINRAQGRAANGLVGLLGPYRKTVIPTIEGSKEIVLPKNVGIIATANIGREYVGTYPLDVALEDRFQPVKIGHAPPEEMVKLLKPRFPEITETVIKVVAESSQILREAFENRMTLQFPPSFRGVEGALTLISHGMAVKEAIEEGFLTKMSDRERQDIWAALEAKFGKL